MGDLDRRAFLRIGATALLGLAVAGPAEAEPEPPRVRRRVPLGRTGLELPDVGFGGSRLAGACPHGLPIAELALRAARLVG
jgi:hypothetical protein